MTQDDLQIGKLVEYAGSGKPDPLQPSLIVPAQPKGCQREVSLLVDPRIVCLSNRGERRLRVNEERDTQRRRLGEQGA